MNYKVVNAYIWKIFTVLYGADQEIKLKGKDINSYIGPENKVEVIILEMTC